MNIIEALLKLPRFKGDRNGVERTVRLVDGDPVKFMVKDYRENKYGGECDLYVHGIDAERLRWLNNALGNIPMAIVNVERGVLRGSAAMFTVACEPAGSAYVKNDANAIVGIMLDFAQVLNGIEPE